MQWKNRGFTVLELLIVIAIIGILTTLIIYSVTSSRNRAHDVSIKNDIRQLRVQAEIAYAGQGQSFLDWTQYAAVQNEISTLLEDIDANYGHAAGAPYVTATRHSQVNNFCVSAPSKANSGTFFCIDATGVMQETTEHCVSYTTEDEDTNPLRCP